MYEVHRDISDIVLHVPPTLKRQKESWFGTNGRMEATKCAGDKSSQLGFVKGDFCGIREKGEITERKLLKHAEV